jgi:hypothetical protein
MIFGQRSKIKYSSILADYIYENHQVDYRSFSGGALSSLGVFVEPARTAAR